MLLDQLQTEYRDRFISLTYGWALKYSPTQPREKGRWVKGGGVPLAEELPELAGGMTTETYHAQFGPKSEHPLLAKMREKLPHVKNMSDLPRPKFVLPDGTLLASGGGMHAEAAELIGSDLDEVMKAGALRLVVVNGNVVGVASRGPITETQAQVLVDGAWRLQELDVDTGLDSEYGQEFFKSRVSWRTKNFSGNKLNATAVRHWVNEHWTAEKFDPTQPRDAKGRWVLDKTGQPLTVYHGSVSPNVTGSKLNPNQPPVRPRSGPNGIYFTSNAQSAYNYIRMPGAGIKGPKGRVIPANIRMNNPLDITDTIKKGQKKGLSFGEAKRKALEDLTPDHDGVIFRGDDYNPDEYIVFSADQIGPVQSIAKKFVEILKYDPNQPRGKGGKWVKGGGSGPTITETNDGYQRTLTMTVDGKVVGAAKYHLSTYNKKLMEFDILHIDPKARDKGHGEQLYRAVVERAKELGATELLGDVTSSGVLRLGIKVMGQPNYIADAVQEYTLDEAMKKLEPLAPENAEGIIDTGNYLAVRWSLGAKKFDPKQPRDAQGQWTESGVPKEPGTTPIPPGKIRGYHYTTNMDAVEREGLNVSHARGHIAAEPDAIWFSTAKPSQYRDYVEVLIDPEDVAMMGGPVRAGEDKNSPEVIARIAEWNKGDHDFMVYAKGIPPERFVTTHRPWHDHYRYFEENPDTAKAVLAGEFDDLLSDPEHGPAIKLFKEKHAKGK